MKIRIALLIVIGIGIIGASVFSVFYYNRGREGQYDELILRYSTLEGEPGLEPVDPAVVKAIIHVRTNFSPFVTGANGERGLMFIPKDGVEKFMGFHGNGDYVIVNAENEKEFGFVCPNRSFPNHKDVQKLYPRAVTCPVCDRRTVEAIFDWEANIKIGTWYLAYATAYLKENIEGIDDEKLLDYSIEAYSYGLETFERVTGGLKDFSQVEQLRPDMERIKAEAERFRPRLEKRARKLGLSSSR